MATDAKSTECTLTHPRDWDRWLHALKNQAVSKNLWQHILGNEPLIERPEMPRMQDIAMQTGQSRRGRGGSFASGSGRNSRHTRTAGADDDENPDPNENIEVNAPPPRYTDEARNYFSMAVQEYNMKEKLFVRQEKELDALKEWFAKTVAAHHYQVACDPTKPLSMWYRNLQELVGLDNSQGKDMARREYQAALKPLIRPRDWETWLEAWQKAMTRAEQREVAEAMAPDSFVPDFLRAVRPVAENWASNYKQINREALNRGTITRMSLTNDFRQEMMDRPETTARKVGKGAFGPTFSGQEAPSYSNEKKTPSPKGRTKKRERAPTDTGTDCWACSQRHPLARCYYAFPELAPEWFVPRPEIQAEVEDKMDSDEALKAKVKSLRSKRPRTKPEPKLRND